MSDDPNSSEYFDNSIWPLNLRAHMDLLDAGYFVPDTNILLDFHRMPDPSERELWFELLFGLQDRIWIPHQVIAEYRANRLAVRRQHESDVTATIERFDGRTESMLKDLWRDARRLRAPLEPLRELTKGFSAYGKAITDNLSSARWNQYSANNRDDLERAIEANIEELAANRTGDEPPKEKLRRWRRESADRHNEKLPPSWADKRKGGSEELHGDYIIFMQMVERAREADHIHRPIIFVTNDRKPIGWMEHQAGVPIGAHSRLVKDMNDLAGVPFVVIGPHHLLQYVYSPAEEAVAHELDWGDEPSDDALVTLQSFLLPDEDEV